MLNQSGVYQIVNIINGKCYIGSAVCFRKRWNNHKLALKKNKHHSPYLQASWNKHGEENFKFEILLTCSKEELIFKEQQQINWYRPAYNICKVAGSKLGQKQSKETRRKISEKAKGNTRWLGKRHTEESKIKQSQVQKGNQNRLGYVTPEESKIKIRKSLTGRILSNEHKMNIKNGVANMSLNVYENMRRLMRLKRQGRKPNLGKKASPELRAKLSEIQKAMPPEVNLKKGAKHKGVPKSEEQKLKMSEARKRFWANKKLKKELL